MDALSRRDTYDLAFNTFSLWQYVDMEEFEVEMAMEGRI